MHAIKRIITYNPSRWMMSRVPFYAFMSNTTFQPQPLKDRVAQTPSPSAIDLFLDSTDFENHQKLADKQKDVDLVILLVHGVGYEQPDADKYSNDVLNSTKNVLHQWYWNSPPIKVQVKCLVWKDAVQDVTRRQEQLFVASSSQRRQVHNYATDILAFMTPHIGDLIIKKTADELVHSLEQIKADPATKNAKIALCTHSLGSVIAFEALTGIQTRPVNYYDPPDSNDKATSSSVRKKLIPQELMPDALFLWGSPLGCFLSLKADQKRTQEHSHDGDSLNDQKVNSGGSNNDNSSPLHDASMASSLPIPPVPLYNIFHPLDPVAFRLEHLFMSDEARMVLKDPDATANDVPQLPSAAQVTSMVRRASMSANALLTLDPASRNGVSSTVVSSTDSDFTSMMNYTHSSLSSSLTSMSENLQKALGAAQNIETESQKYFFRQHRNSNKKYYGISHVLSGLKNFIDQMSSEFDASSVDRGFPSKKQLSADVIFEQQLKGNLLPEEWPGGQKRVDYALPTDSFERFLPAHLTMIASHRCYWSSLDVAMFTVRVLFPELTAAPINFKDAQLLLKKRKVANPPTNSKSDTDHN